MTQPQPQQEGKIVWTCYQCDEKFHIGPAVCIAFLYARQMYFNWVWIKCPECAYDHKCFIDHDSLAAYLRAEVGQVVGDFAPEDVIKQYEDVFELSMPTEVELTYRQVTELKLVHWEWTTLSDDEVWGELDADS